MELHCASAADYLHRVWDRLRDRSRCHDRRNDGDIHTDAGMSTREKWEHGPRAYLRIMIAGFPNLFMITGSRSPGVKNQMIPACEKHVDWIGDRMRYLRAHEFLRIEVEKDAEDRGQSAGERVMIFRKFQT